MTSYDSGGKPILSIETDANDDAGRDDWLVHLSITWDGFPDAFAASDFAGDVRDLAVKHFGHVLSPRHDVPLDL